jgi:hypothetical protein
MRLAETYQGRFGCSSTGSGSAAGGRRPARCSRGGGGVDGGRRHGSVRVAEQGLGVERVDGRRALKSSWPPVGRSRAGGPGRQREGGRRPSSFLAGLLGAAATRVGDVLGAGRHVNDIEITWACRANMVHVHLVSVEVSAAGPGRHKEGGAKE